MNIILLTLAILPFYFISLNNFNFIKYYNNLLYIMTSISKTSIVYNNPNKILGLNTYIYRYRKCDTNLTSNTPANQYQKLKLIQNTVRVPASLYISNLGPLNAYVKPTTKTYGVCWNQMSDRPVPSVQKGIIPTGSNSSMNRRHTSVTSSRPGCQSPGGIGCDIKHNSYDRYLNRLKGKGPLRRGPIPSNFGLAVPFNQAYPIYGGKTVKTNIVSGCDCPVDLTPAEKLAQNIEIYENIFWQPDPVSSYSFNIDDYVYAIQIGNNYYTRATIIDISTDGTTYTIQFDNVNIQTVTDVSTLLIYYPCNCNGTIDGKTYASGFLTEDTSYSISKTLSAIYGDTIVANQ
jgi:hypothetical protein